IEVHFRGGELGPVADQRSFGLPELVLERPRIDLRQQLAFAHLLALAEQDLVEAAVHLGADRDRIEGGYVAEAVEVDGHVPALDRSRDHGDGPRRRLGGLFALGARLLLRAGAAVDEEACRSDHHRRDHDQDGPALAHLPLRLPAERAEELRARRGELIVRLHDLRRRLRERDLGVAQLDRAADADLVSLLRQAQAFPGVDQRLLRRAQRLFRGADGQPGPVDVGAYLQPLQVELGHRGDHVRLRLAHLRLRQSALEDVPAQRQAGGRVPAQVAQAVAALLEPEGRRERRRILALERAYGELLGPDLILQG